MRPISDVLNPASCIRKGSRTDSKPIPPCRKTIPVIIEPTAVYGFMRESYGKLMNGLMNFFD
jgi:hypothetical protein